MPESWSSEFDRERSRIMKEAKDAGASDDDAKKQADAAFSTDEQPPSRGRRVAD